MRDQANQTSRLGTSHLMLWTLCTAIALAFDRALNAGSDLTDLPFRMLAGIVAIGMQRRELHRLDLELLHGGRLLRLRVSSGRERGAR